MKSAGPLKVRAYEAILERLLRGVYAPGEAIDRRGMAAELAMSVAPVHEAMNQLEWEGLLETVPRRGTRIRPVRREDVYGHLVLREALECQIARLIHGARVRRQQAALLPLAERADAREGDDVRHCTDEVAFHHRLAELTDCAALVEQYRRIMHLGSFYRVSLLLPFSPTVAYSHVRLLAALAGDDSGAAEAASRDHIWVGKPAWLTSLRDGETRTDPPTEAASVHDQR